MTKIHHINCGTLIVEGYPTAVCHCLLVEDSGKLVLIDTGIGLLDIRHPVERLGQPLIDIAGFQFNEPDTAVRQIERLGYSITQVQDIVLTHCDPDHTGGLGDFPNAQVHLSEEELSCASSGHWRYIPKHFEHKPRWRTYARSDRTWFGFEARTVALDFSTDILLIPLFGHTFGHCGVAIQDRDNHWLLHAGDAYYLRDELTMDNHPVSAFAAQRADDNQERIASLNQLRRLLHAHSDEIEMIGYHDIKEIPNFEAMNLQR